MDIKGRILIADDNLSLNALQSFFEGNGYVVFPFRDAGEASDAILDGLKYDVAIIDRSFADDGEIRYSGDDLISLSKQHCKGARVICVSGYSDLPKGANYHLRKPFRTKELLAIVEKCFS